MSKKRLNPAARKLGKEVRRVRMLKGWTFEEMSRKTGCTRAYLCRLEMGNSNPTLSVLMRILGALDMTLTWGPR